MKSVIGVDYVMKCLWRSWRINMKVTHTKVDKRQEVILDPIYMTREMWECSFHYIPLDQRSRVIIVDFIEEEETEDGR